MISICIKRKAFGATEILRDINLSLVDASTVALLGPSGVGKTTLLRIVSGLDQNFTGTIERPDSMAMVFQSPTLLPWRTVLENVTQVAGTSDDQAQSALSDVGLAGKAELFPGQLSLGQQRRLSLARAFSIKPQFLVMDEPFASLDEARVKDMIALCKALIGDTKVTTLMVTHSESEAAEMADKIVRLDGQPATLVQT